MDRANDQRLATTGREGSFNSRVGDVVLSNFIINGDYNGNGIVDAADCALWRKTPASHGGAGGYATWRSNFGRTNIPGAGSSLAGASPRPVPEPGAKVFVILVIAAALLQRTDRRGR